MDTKKILSKINSVQETTKITNAMEKISISKMKKSEKKMMSSKMFLQANKDIIENFCYDTLKDNIFFKEHTSGKSIYIVVSGDKELCGDLNDNIIKLFNEQNQKNMLKIFPVGNIIGKNLSKNDINYEKDFLNINYYLSFDSIISLTNVLIADFIEKKYTTLNIIYTISLDNEYKAVNKQLLPLPKSDFNFKNQNILLEPSDEKVIKRMVEYYLESILYKIIIDCNYIENCRRMKNMKQSTDNGKAIIEELKEKFNKQRQESITMELLDSYANKLKK